MLKLRRQRTTPSTVRDDVTSVPDPSGVRWFHSHDLGNGLITRGDKPLGVLQSEAKLIFKHGVDGRSVLDVGSWDGFFSFEAERRGAHDVLATDRFCWSGEGWGTKAGFDYAHAHYGSKVRSLDVDVFDLDPEQLGTFDVVLFLGVLYHLRNPLGGLAQTFKMTRDLAVIETLIDEVRNPHAVMRYVRGEFGGDQTNFFAPNPKCLERMLFDTGFRRVELCQNQPERMIAHAWK